MYRYMSYGDFLAHHGVKGMQWGVRKAIKNIGRSEARANKKYNRAMAKPTRRNIRKAWNALDEHGTRSAYAHDKIVMPRLKKLGQRGQKQDSKGRTNAANRTLRQAKGLVSIGKKLTESVSNVSAKQWKLVAKGSEKYNISIKRGYRAFQTSPLLTTAGAIGVVGMRAHPGNFIKIKKNKSGGRGRTQIIG